MEIKSVKIDVPEGCNVIIGTTHFIKSVEDLHEAMINSLPNAKFGLAFCEASGPRLVRRSGSDKDLTKLAADNAMKMSAGHSFIIYMKDSFPINVLNAIKAVPEVCTIHCATANPVEVIVAESVQGRGILGVIDGGSSLGIETEKNVKEREEFLRKIGYKL